MCTNGYLRKCDGLSKTRPFCEPNGQNGEIHRLRVLADENAEERERRRGERKREREGGGGGRGGGRERRERQKA